MEKNIDYNNFYGFGGYPPPYSPYENIDPTSSPESNFFNPMYQITSIIHIFFELIQ